MQFNHSEFMLLEAFNFFSAHAALTSSECCGLIVGEDYHPCKNIELGSEHFTIHPDDWLRIEKFGPIRAVCHSHPGASSKASSVDIRACQASGIPWYILGNDGLNRIDPFPIPLEQRPFVYGWQDCYSVIRDYFGGLPDFPREISFWEKGHSPYIENFKANGFEEVSISDAITGDILLMKIKSISIPNHAAVYLGAGKILHHLYGQLSRHDEWGPFQKHTTHVLRRKSC